MYESMPALFGAYNGDGPFLFVSYKHTNYSRVEAILRLLHYEGLRIWYDQGGDAIPKDSNWLEWIDNRLEHCASFIAFLTNDAVGSDQVIREIQAALKRKERNPAFKVLLVFLDHVPAVDFPEDIKSHVKDFQCMLMYQYGGLTERFVSVLLGKDVFDGALVDDEVRAANGKAAWESRSCRDLELEDSMEVLLSDSEDNGRQYVFPQAIPPEPAEVTIDLSEKDFKPSTAFDKAPDAANLIRFYKVSPGQTDPAAIYPICLDNQWVPEFLFSDEDFLEHGFASERVKEIQRKAQRYEIFHGLLHSWQMIVNRASLYNSQVFADIYREPGDLAAFQKLIGCGAMVPFLYNETCPVASADFHTSSREEWIRVCREVPPYCLRMDWESEDSNTLEISKLISAAFHNYCLTACDDSYEMEDMVRAVGISDDQREEFLRFWKKIQVDVVTDQLVNPKHKKRVSREMFYQTYVVRDKSSVDQCLIDPDKPFARELKQIIDFRYATNLPRALGLRALIPANSNVGRVMNYGEKVSGNFREISGDELACAVKNFLPGAVIGSGDSALMYLPVSFGGGASLPPLSELVQMRQMSGWRAYMRAVSAGEHRAKLNEIDLNDVSLVWSRYRRWMEEVRHQFAGYEWVPAARAVSFLFRFNGVTVTAVYRLGEAAFSLLLPEGKDLDYIEHVTSKTSLAVDYVCGDISDPRIRGNVMLTELRLFDGLTHVAGKEVYRQLVKALEECRF